MYELLRKVPLVAGLPDTDLEHLRRCRGSAVTRRGLLAEDSPGDQTFFVKGERRGR